MTDEKRVKWQCSSRDHHRCILHQARVGALPRFPNGESDYSALRDAPVFNVNRLAVSDPKPEFQSPAKPKKERQRESDCAWARMQWACFRFTEITGQNEPRRRRAPPGVETLLLTQWGYFAGSIGSWSCATVAACRLA